MKSRHLVLAIATGAQGYAFALFDGPESLFDWGVRKVRTSNKNPIIVDRITRLMRRHHPDILILEDPNRPATRHATRHRQLHHSIRHLAMTEQVPTKTFTRAAVKRCFATVGANTKYEVAQAVARHLPALEHRLPPVRKPWMSERPGQLLFDAAALGLTYHAHSDDCEDE